MGSGTDGRDGQLAIGVGLGPRDRIPHAARQAVLDAAALLQVLRRELAAEVARRSVPGVRLVARSEAEVHRWIGTAAPTWRDLLSIRPAATSAQLRVSLPGNRRLLAEGLRMVSIFDNDGIRSDARVLLANEPTGTYLFGVGPVQMKIVDRSTLLLSGPAIDGASTLMAVRSGPCLEAAWRYWEVATAAAFPARGSVAPPVDLTPRQHQVVALLAGDLGDDTIAEALGVSVRTVRSDVAAILSALGVRSRFAAGLRLRPPSD